jgi:acyl-CoA synthetase (AMP-forming)/AMP-acid ligase II
VVVAGEASRVSHAAVVEWCRARLAEHKVPRSVVLVDEIPRTSRGKIDRRSLAKLAAEHGERARTV